MKLLLHWYRCVSFLRKVCSRSWWFCCTHPEQSALTNIFFLWFSPLVPSLPAPWSILHRCCCFSCLAWFCVYCGSVHPVSRRWFSAHHHRSTPLLCKISSKDQIIPPTKAIRTVLLLPAFWLLWNSTTMALSGVVIGLPGLLLPVCTWNPRTWVAHTWAGLTRGVATTCTRMWMGICYIQHLACAVASHWEVSVCVLHSERLGVQLDG